MMGIIRALSYNIAIAHCASVRCPVSNVLGSDASCTAYAAHAGGRGRRERGDWGWLLGSSGSCNHHDLVRAWHAGVCGFTAILRVPGAARRRTRGERELRACRLGAVLGRWVYVGRLRVER